MSRIQLDSLASKSRNNQNSSHHKTCHLYVEFSEIITNSIVSSMPIEVITCNAVLAAAHGYILLLDKNNKVENTNIKSLCREMMDVLNVDNLIEMRSRDDMPDQVVTSLNLFLENCGDSTIDRMMQQPVSHDVYRQSAKYLREYMLLLMREIGHGYSY